MNKEIVLSLKEEPVNLLQEKAFEELIKYSETNQKKLNHFWQNKSSEDFQLFIKYATSKLVFFKKYIEDQEKQYSLFKIGELLGAVESYENILYEKQQEELTVNRIYSEGHTIKYLNAIVELLESHGGLTHSELCDHLVLKTSTLSEAIKKVLVTGLVDVRNSGKYKIYSLTDKGIRYGKYVRNQKRQVTNEEQVLTLLKQSIDNIHSEHAVEIFKRKIREILESDNLYTINHKRITLHIDSPTMIEIEDVEVNRIENSINGKTDVYCKSNGSKIGIDKTALLSNEIKRERQKLALSNK